MAFPGSSCRPTAGRRRRRDRVVKQFYEKTPFPNYDDLDNQRALLEKARAGRFARLLNEQIPYRAHGASKSAVARAS